jgi:tetratricopeptide (TPR) repeat protein
LNRVQSLNRVESNDALYLAGYYSRGLNTWGVALQRSSNPNEAGKMFSRAVGMNTNNVAAQINADFNKTLRAGKPQSKENPQMLEEQLGKYRSWDSVLFENGGFDEPYVCARLGGIFQEQGFFRQSIQELQRVLAFQPTNTMAQFSLTTAYISGGWPDVALEYLAKLRRELPGNSSNHVQLAVLESSAYFGKKDVKRAEEHLKKTRTEYPNSPLLLQSLFEIYNRSGDYTNAIATLDEQLKLSPTNTYTLMQKAEMFANMEQYDKAKTILDDIIAKDPRHVPALLYKGFLDVQVKDFSDALAVADKVLQIDPDNPQALTYEGIAYMEQKQYDKAIKSLTKGLEKVPGNVAIRRNRAIAYLRADKLDEAQKEYESLQQVMRGSHVIYYGLGEVAYRRKNFAEAAKNFEAYLKYAPKEGSTELIDERKQVEAKLQEIKSRK